VNTCNAGDGYINSALVGLSVNIRGSTRLTDRVLSQRHRLIADCSIIEQIWVDSYRV
jgi:hypothetical protein